MNVRFLQFVIGCGRSCGVGFARYIDKIPIKKIRELVALGSAAAVPAAEAFKWERWVDLQDGVQLLRCQSGCCPAPGHEIRYWKWQDTNIVVTRALDYERCNDVRW